MPFINASFRGGVSEKYEICNHAPYSDVGIYRCYTSWRVALLRISEGVKQRLIATELHTKSVGISTVTVAILRNDGVYITGIKNNTRATNVLKGEN